MQPAPDKPPAEQPPTSPESASVKAVELWLEAELIAERCDREWAAVEEADGGQGTASAFASAGVNSVRRMKAEMEAESVRQDGGREHSGG